MMTAVSLAARPMQFYPDTVFSVDHGVLWIDQPATGKRIAYAPGQWRNAQSVPDEDVDVFMYGPMAAVGRSL